MADIRETALPGVGLRHEFTTGDGKIIGMISYRTGRHELFVGSVDDPDTPVATIDLDEDERKALADILGTSRITESLTRLQQRVTGLAIDWIQIEPASPYAEATIGDTQARSRTGVSVVAVLRQGTAVPAPGPDQRLRVGDTLVVVGTPDGIRSLGDLLAHR